MILCNAYKHFVLFLPFKSDDENFFEALSILIINCYLYLYI